MTDNETINRFKTLVGEYKTQSAAADALSKETGANFTQSNLSRMMNGESTSKTLLLAIYAFEQLVMKNTTEYQYTLD